MSKTYKDGWRTVCGFFVYVENGCIKRGTIGENFTLRAIYPYIPTKDGGYDLDQTLTVSAFRSRYYRGTVKMF